MYINPLDAIHTMEEARQVIVAVLLFQCLILGFVSARPDKVRTAETYLIFLS